MQIERVCKYASECPVYQDQITNLGKPVFLVRNVFCNRGSKGWSNCVRLRTLEAGQPVNEETTPYKL